MRVVLDTNIIISGLLSEKGQPGLLLRRWLEGKYELATSKAQLDELVRGLNYKKFRTRISSVQATDFLGHIDTLAIIVGPIPIIDLSPDPDDNAILATAIKANVDLIVSGDKSDLLSLKEVDDIPILTARQAMERLTNL